MAASLSKRIRAEREHDDGERFDLANYTQVQAEELITLAYSTPWETFEPVRNTFIVGGGKLVRQKYNDELLKWLCAALRKIGYEDDKGAAVGSQGVYKTQHDLGQNLIYLHVYPKTTIATSSSSSSGGGGGGATGAGDSSSSCSSSSAAPSQAAIDADPKLRVLACEVFDFHKLVPSRIIPWLQKRRVLLLLQAKLHEIEDIETALASRKELTPAQTSLYEMTSRSNLEEKITWLQAAMKEQVTSGALTVPERTIVLTEMEDKLKQLERDVVKATSGGEKAPAGLLKQRDGLTARRDAVRSVFQTIPAVSYPVKGIADIKRMKLEIARLDKFEASTAGNTLTSAQALARSKELDNRVVCIERLQELQEEAQGWFEEAAEYEGRVREQLAAMGGGAAKAARR